MALARGGFVGVGRNEALVLCVFLICMLGMAISEDNRKIRTAGFEVEQRSQEAVVTSR